MARINYTGSPLGIITSDQIKYSIDNNTINSIFSSSTTMNKPSSGTLSKIKTSGGNQVALHNDDIYDLSTPHIIDKLKSIPALALRAADFAYLKNYGVYPNNRLVAIRRFETPVQDDLFAIPDMKSPLATILGYVEDIGSMVKIDVSEGWGDSDPTIKKLLNDFGEDIMKNAFSKGGLGGLAGEGFNVIPMGNLTTVLQRKILTRMGVIGENDASDLPIADPNIIREAKQRKMVGEENSGSGLSGKFKISLTTEYEQKFLNGVDPTIVYMDIINNALQMGTSRSTFFLGRRDDYSQKLQATLQKLSKDPMGQLQEWIDAIIDSMKEGIEKLKNVFSQPVENKSTDEEDKNSEETKNNLDIVNMLSGVSTAILQNIIKKYRIQLLGTIANMTGAASTPWHVTVGNPLRPIFVSGDMVCTGVEIEPGNILAFNNLPNTIKIKISLESARNLGLQEIFAKYNAGSIRTINGTYVSSGPTDFYGSDNYVYNKKQPNRPTDQPKKTNQSPEIDSNNTNTTTQTTKAINNSGQNKVNNDANSTEVIIPATENTGGISNSATTKTIQPITSGPNAKIIKS